MENKSAENRSPVLIVAGLVAIIVITLVVLGLFAIQQRPVEVASAGKGANTEAVAVAATTPTNETSIVTETTTAVVTDTATAVVTETASTMVTDTAAAVVTATTTTVITDTAAAVVTATAAAVVTTTASISGTNAAVTETIPVTAAAPVDVEAVTAAVIKGTCNACHTIAGIDIAVGVIGPDLSTIGTDAATRIEGYTAEAYLRESILNPNAFIAPKCPTGDCLPGLMLPNLADILTAEEIDTIINYLLTLN